MSYAQKHIIAFVCVLLSFSAGAQQRISFSLIPLQKDINVHILGSDTSVLGCYNLYGYSYVKGVDTLEGEFIVFKDADSFSMKRGTVQLKLCRVLEFAMPAGNNCRNIPVESGIEITYPGQNEKVFLNFDPTMPDAVFMPCK